MSALSQLRELIVQQQFPNIIDLRTQVHISLWSDINQVPKTLIDLLPFGQTLHPLRFYSFIDYQLDDLVDAASNTLLYWSLAGIQQFNGEPATQITLFFDDTFFWHYVIPAKEPEILETLQNGNRVRFLSRFCLSETQIELEFNEIRYITNPFAPAQLVYTDSKEYTYKWSETCWELTIHNTDPALENPHLYTAPHSQPNTLGREAEYQAQLQLVLAQISNFPIGPAYWSSVETTPVSSRGSSPSPLPIFIITRASPPALAECFCGIDLCRCGYRPDTPPTPPFLELWEPSQGPEPRRGIHFGRHEEIVQSGSSFQFYSGQPRQNP